jgi:hypothetical protein
LDSHINKIEVRHFAPSINCPHCQKQIEVPTNVIGKYINDEDTCCPLCLAEIDWWNAILKLIRMNSSLGHSSMPIGAQFTLFVVKMTHEDIVKIKFSDFGLPDNLVILGVNITPQGPGVIVTLEWPEYYIQNQTLSYLRLYGNKRENYPSEITDVAITVSWIYHSFDNEAWKHIMEAFRHYQKNNFLSSIIPANIAFESILLRFLTSAFEKIVTKEHVKSFLSDGATYSHQLNVLLPFIARLTNTKVLLEHVRGHLNRLRRIRNELVHSGNVECPLSEDDVAQLLCSVLFGFHYILVCGPNILRSI